MLASILNSKSKTLFAFCFCFLLGIIIVSIIDFRFDFVYPFFIILFFLAVFWSNKKTRFVFFCLLFILLGIIRYLIVFPTGSFKNIIHYVGQERTVSGYIYSEPDVRTDGVRYIVKSLQGKIYFKTNLYPRYQYGDQLRVECQLEKPEPIEDFRYDMYLARYGVFVLCLRPEIEKIGQGQGNLVLEKIFSFKQIVAQKINRLWHEPDASFMAGLLYGYRGGLGELNELFNRTGVTHIVAISGYNISIVANVLIVVSVSLYIPRKKAFWIISAGIVLFVIFAGASASVVRAGMMGIIVLLAKQMGRLSRVGNVMILTAVIMSLHNPLILIWDAGFQLSFVATLGLIYLSPLIARYFKAWPEFLGIKESLVSTLAAIFATLPLIVFHFKRLSLVAPIVNVLILWLIPFIMLFGFLAVLLSFVFPPLAEVVSWLAWLGLKYIIIIVKWFAALDFASLEL